MSTPHYARTVPYAQLEAELHAARAERLVYWKDEGPLRLWCYTSKAVYDRAWSPAVLAARGLVLDRDRQVVVATAFPKFFNVGELGQPVPDEPCEVFEKVDGSLIVIFHDGARWRAATKGALDSAQALWAQRRLDVADLAPLVTGVTYLAEAIYPENKIIVPYEETGLVVLAAYGSDGIELTSAEVEQVAGALGWRAARRQAFASVGDAIRARRHAAEERRGLCAALRERAAAQGQGRGLSPAARHDLACHSTWAVGCDGGRR